VCCVRDINRFFVPIPFKDKVTVEVDFLKEDTLGEIPNDIDAAYYLIHSMSSSADNYDKLEKASALNFVSQIKQKRNMSFT
jgi:predicted aldo/keto reductase-like oxidoreductase